MSAKVRLGWLGQAAVGVAFAGLVGAALMPSLVMNLGPLVSQLAAPDAVLDGTILGSTALQGIAVGFMALSAVAVSRTSRPGVRYSCLFFCVILFALNSWNAMDTAAHRRDAVTAPLRDLIHKAATLSNRIAGLERERKEVPQHDTVTAPVVAAAESAAATAELQRDQRCRVAGRNSETCRRETDEVSRAQTALAALLRDRGFSETLERILSAKSAAQRELDALGAIPKHADPTAARAAEALRIIFPLGDDAEEVVSEWWPVFVGVSAELIALFGPIVAFEICYGSGGKPIQPIPRAPSAPRRPAAPRAAAPRVTHETSAQGDVQEWLLSRTTSRPGSRVRAGECFENYRNWCAECERQPISLSAFGTMMKGPLGVLWEDKSKRRFYLDIALTGRPTLLVG